MAPFTPLPPNEHGHIARPASPFWIFGTFLFSYVLNILGTTAQWFWLPDFFAITLVYWTVHQPRSVGMTVAFVCGILMDVHNGNVLGQQPLAYVTLAFIAYSLHRRLPWFGLFGQALHVLPILLVAQVLVMLVRLWFDGLWPGFSWFLQSFTGALLWPLWSWLMSTPQRRSAADDL